MYGMSWFHRGAASVLGRELGQWPYPIGFSRVLRDRHRATANDLEADVCSFTYASFNYSVHITCFVSGEVE